MFENLKKKCHSRTSIKLDKEQKFVTVFYIEDVSVILGLIEAVF